MTPGGPDFVIVPLLMSDFVEIRAIERLGQQRPWSDDVLLAELTGDNAMHFGARSLENGSLSAFILSRLVIDELHINNLCTDPLFRRRGYGRSLLRQAFSQARSRNATRAFLEVASGNAAAISLYQSAGFSVDYERKAYYASGEDALVMSVEL